LGSRRGRCDEAPSSSRTSAPATGVLGRRSRLTDRRAIEIGNHHNHGYKNDHGVAVEWRFEKVLTLDLLGGADLDGREVHSLLTGEAGDPAFDTRFTPETVEPGETGYL
jgi:hypothetical protein